MSIGTGLFALRYRGAADAAQPPRIVVSVHPDFLATVTLAASPGRPEGWLEVPDDVLVVRSERPAALIVAIAPGPSSRSDQVTLKLERLDREGPAATPWPADAPVPRVTGHFARRGDVTAPLGTWLGHEAARLPLEGLALAWPDRPAGADVEYAVSALGQGRLPAALTGGFVGGRGGARAVNGVFMRLVGERASDFVLAAEAVFGDGSRRGPMTGRVDLFGPTGREPLVALRIELRARSSLSAEARAVATAPAAIRRESWAADVPPHLRVTRLPLPRPAAAGRPAPASPVSRPS